MCKSEQVLLDLAVFSIKQSFINNCIICCTNNYMGLLGLGTEENCKAELMCVCERVEAKKKYVLR